jgi:hypothetical protein
VPRTEVGGQTAPRIEAGGPTTTLGGPTARTCAAPSLPASPTSATPHATPTTMVAPQAALSTPPAPRVAPASNYGRTTRGSRALLAALLTSPSGCARATGTTSTSAVVAREGRTDGTSEQSSSDDHAGEVGLPASGQKTHPVGHLSVNLCRRCPPPSTPPSSIRTGAVPWKKGLLP